MKYSARHFILAGITIFIAILPFFWLSPGEMDLGGDSTRLYFYDPVAKLSPFAWYGVAPYGTGKILYNYYFIPYLLFLSGLKFIVQSPTVLIALFNALKLGGSFLFVFLTVLELLRINIRTATRAQCSAALVAGLFYAFSPAVLENMKYALVTHDMVFINPLIVYLLVRSLKESALHYAWLAILVSVLFSTSFGMFNPPLYAFYPLAIVFLYTYNRFVLRKPFPWAGAGIIVAFYLGIHAFHIVPVLSTVFDAGSEFNSRVFESASGTNGGLEYFNAIRESAKVSRNILLPRADLYLAWSLLFVPALAWFGLLHRPKKDMTLPLVSIFFLITLFLMSANITDAGVRLYQQLFSIPGFGMFRGFFGQWQWVYTFFYTLFAGVALSYAYALFRPRTLAIVTAGILLCIALRSPDVFTGDIVDVYRNEEKTISVAVAVDPAYEEMMAYIKNLPDEGKIMHMPFTDYGYGIVGGKNNGVYIGTSFISEVVGRNDFAGYQHIDPYSEVFKKLVTERNYPLISHMFGMLNIRYVLYNSDVKVSDEYFPAFPYGHNGVPTDQETLKQFVNEIAPDELFSAGTYSLRKIPDTSYLPELYIARRVETYEVNPDFDKQYSQALSFFPENSLSPELPKETAYIKQADCEQELPAVWCLDDFAASQDSGELQYEKINPTRYRVSVSGVSEPVLLVFSKEYSTHWKLYDEQRELTDAHIRVNGYANAWYIPSGFNGTLEMTGQRLFYRSGIVSIVAFCIFLLYGILILWRKRKT